MEVLDIGSEGCFLSDKSGMMRELWTCTDISNKETEPWEYGALEALNAHWAHPGEYCASLQIQVSITIPRTEIWQLHHIAFTAVSYVTELLNLLTSRSRAKVNDKVLL